MKFTHTSAALALGVAAGVSADDWSADPATTTSDWTTSVDPATKSTTTDWTTSDWTTSSVDPATTTGWADWTTSGDPATTTTGWGDWSTTKKKKTTTTTTTSYGWSWPFDPKKHQCAATSTETVWAVGTTVKTGTITSTIYAATGTAATEWYSAAPTVTATDTVTVWVLPGGGYSTEWPVDPSTAWTADPSTAWTADPVTSTVGWDPTTSVDGVWSAITSAVGGWDPTLASSGVWPAESDPTGWGSDVISVIGTNADAGWTFTHSIPTKTGWTGPTGSSAPNGTSGNQPLPETDCNTADDRSKWCGDFDISTDYYQTYPNTGKVCAYDFVITNTTLNFDGTDVLAFAINGQSPGPLIECNWGDTVQITVTNNMQNNGTAIHWHGVRQKGTNSQDGVPGVTECALAPGETRTYTWVAASYGTSWYHSHWLTQYGDGLRGPIVIHGPATANYDIDMGPVMLADTFNVTAQQAYDVISHTGPGGTVNYLLNGKNVKADLSAGSHALWQVQPGKKHLFRFVNSAAQNMFSVHFDNHVMQVIAVDFVPITPYTTDWLNIAIGQRFDVIITANQPSGNYFLRAVTQTGCPSECDNNGLGSANGIIQYAGATLTLPVSDFGNKTIDDFAICTDEPMASLVPYLVKSAGSATAFSAQASTLPAGNVALTQTSDDGAIFRWFLNGGAIDVNYTQPTLKNLAESPVGNSSNVVYLNNAANTWVYFVIQNQFFAGHPIHLHGHDFSLLGQQGGSPSPIAAPTLFTADDVASLNFDNPPRRDTAMLVDNGWTVIGFETDNPGAWLMHCHIVWHVDGGLAMQFVERESDIDAPHYITSDFESECSSYATYEAASPSHLKTGGESGLRRRWMDDLMSGPHHDVVRRSESHEKRFLESHLKRGLGDGYKPRHGARR